MTFSRLFGFMGRDLAMDLGTANSLMYCPRRGIIMNEPSVVALDQRDGKVLAVGREAKEFLGRTPERIRAVRPLKDGVIADFDVTRAMIAYFVRKAMSGFSLIRPRMVVCVPTGITQVEKRAVVESAEAAGARDVRLIEEPMAAAIGAGLPVNDPTGSMVVDIGGGTTEVAVMSLSAVAHAESLRVAGDELNEAIQRHLQERFQLYIGENTAEKIKIAVGSAVPLEAPLHVDVPGKNVLNGSPTVVRVSDTDIREALAEPVAAIVLAVRKALERTPAELVGDIASSGLLLAGGGALLKGLDRRIAEACNLKVRIDEDPLTTVVRGTGLALAEMRKYKNVFVK